MAKLQAVAKALDVIGDDKKSRPSSKGTGLSHPKQRDAGAWVPGADGDAPATGGFARTIADCVPGPDLLVDPDSACKLAQGKARAAGSSQGFQGSAPGSPGRRACRPG